MCLNSHIQKISIEGRRHNGRGSSSGSHRESEWERAGEGEREKNLLENSSVENFHEEYEIK